MNDNLDPTIEDRLRRHYHHLREQPPAASPRQHRSRALVGAACLVLALVAGGAYLGFRNPSPGQPIQTDLGPAAENGARESTTSTTTPTTETTQVAPEELTPTSITAEQSTPTTAVAAGSAGGDSGSTNVDGSPVAPTPGTVAPPDGADLALAYGAWEPSEHDTCSRATHDLYWVYGPDGKVYPTYHPPVDPATGCRFGHEHGRDPAGSDLADIPFPFGYVGEIAAGAGVGLEDHVGHKIEWYNDGGYYERGNPNSNHDQVCDVAYKVHMGTHSDEAFENNTHEVFHYARCENGSELIYRALHAFGEQGEFNLHCDQGAGPTVAVGRGDNRSDGNAGSREIPAETCFEDRVLVSEGEKSDWFPFDERWTLYQSVDSDDFGRFFIQFFFFVDVPARYWDGEKLARTVDLCYRSGERQVRDDEFCEPMRADNPGVRVPWDSPESPFNGADRQVFMIDIRVDNNAGQTDWYTDLHGGVWSAEPFEASIRQHVGTTPIQVAASYRPSPIRRITFDEGLGLHAPN